MSIFCRQLVCIPLLLLLILLPKGFAVSSAELSDSLKIQQINEQLYRFSNGNDYGALLVGETGIAIGDPMDVATATKLEQWIKSQFNLPVLYVFYSRTAPQRTKGTSVFKKHGATVIAHANAVTAPTVTGGEIIAPDIVFQKELTLNLGADTVTLAYFGNSLTADSIVAWFPQQDAVYTGDMVAVGRLPELPIADAHFPDWFSTIDKLAQVKFSYLLPGQGKLGIRSDAVKHSYYLRELHTRVSKAIDAGDNDNKIANNIAMSRYANWENYASQLQNNVQDMITAIRRTR